MKTIIGFIVALTVIITVFGAVGYNNFDQCNIRNWRVVVMSDGTYRVQWFDWVHWHELHATFENQGQARTVMAKVIKAECNEPIIVGVAK